jgi:hypothetical protein
MKTQNDTLMRAAIDGAGLTRWEAQVLPSLVQEIYFNAGAEPLRDGQILYQCTALNEGPGKPLKECQQVQVRLTVLSVDDDLSVRREDGQTAARRQALCRITEEAREQGGLLTQDDLAFILHSSVRTVRRDIAFLRDAQHIHVATRGYLRDIGPSVSHKGIALRHWFAGLEPVAVARQINHSLGAVERYLGDFQRVAFAAMQGLDATTTARMTHLSLSLVETYRSIYEEFKEDPAHAYRFHEIRLLSSAPEQTSSASTEKKGDPTLLVSHSRCDSVSPTRNPEVCS